MTVTTSLAKAFSFTFSAPSKTAILPCSGDLSNQQIRSIGGDYPAYEFHDADRWEGNRSPHSHIAYFRSVQSRWSRQA
jgi:hypothetical protein